MLVVGIVGFAFFWSNASNKQKLSQRAQELQDQARGLTGPILRSQHEVSLAPTVSAKAKEPIEVKEPQPVHPMNATAALIRVYTGKPSAPEPDPLGDYAPYGRLVKCELVNTVDSSSLTTPIIGLVSEDVSWDGKVIIPRRSEAHGTAQVDRVRERISSEGLFTFVLNNPENPGLGRELVVKGIALDREEDPNFQTFGITDGSAGLRGVVIKTDKLADVKLFLATFLSGIGEGLKSTTTNVFGTVQNNPNGNTAGIPGYIINPVAQGSQNVLDLYAQQILKTIEEDGFFIRVQAGKQFYIYVKQVIDLNKAVVDGDPARERSKKEYLQDRSEEEKISQPRAERDEMEKLSRGAASSPNQLDQARVDLERANQDLNQLNQPPGNKPFYQQPAGQPQFTGTPFPLKVTNP